MDKAFPFVEQRQIMICALFVCWSEAVLGEAIEPGCCWL
jgi:hypothetical protein